MDRFVATYTMRLDAKGRVSIPASFRAVLARDGFEGLYCQPSPGHPALDAGGNALIQEIEALIERFPPYSEERDDLAAALYGQSEILKVDPEGRMILSERMKTIAHIDESVVFVGLGHKFQIWEPERFFSFLEEASEKVKALRRQPGPKSAGEPPGAKG
jgi:MraZ protein